jgi:cytoskeleton protein RodZ
VGEILRHAREDQNLTLDQVAQVLHIRARFLEALEASDTRALPSLAQSRGFLRLYAEYLGLDPLPLLESWKPVEKTPSVSGKPLNSGAAAPKKVSHLLSRVMGTTSRSAEGQADPDTLSEARTAPPHSEQLFTEIGLKLKRQRETLEMSIEEVALFSKIKPQTLLLLEKMDMHELPSPVIVRGLLLTYADAVHMDRDELLSLFADALQARREERSARAGRGKGSGKADSTITKPAPLIAINARRLTQIDWKGLSARLSDRVPFLKKYLSIDILAGGILIIALAVVITWAAASTLSLSAQRIASEATLPGRSEILAAGPARATDTSLLFSITSTPGADLEASQDAGIVNNPGLEGAVVKATYLVTLPANADAAFRVTVRPLQTAFVQIWVDDRLAFKGRMAPGADFPFNARRRVELLTGDAGALQVFFNATDLGILGISGEVVHLVFTVRGAQTITPTVTSTFTPTPRPSLTPRPTTTKRPTLTPKP